MGATPATNFTDPSVSFDIPALVTDPFDADYVIKVLKALDLHTHVAGFGAQIPTAGIANLAITAAKLALLAVATGNIQDSAVTADKIADAAVTTAKLADSAVTAAKADATSLPTANKIMVRDASGRAQVAAPSADADIARLDTIKDIRQSSSASGASVVAFANGAYADIDSMSVNITLAKTSTIMVLTAITVTANAGAASIYLKAFTDATDLGEWIDDVGADTHIISTHWLIASVAAGAHTIKMQGYRLGDAKSYGARRITVLVFPTAS